MSEVKRKTPPTAVHFAALLWGVILEVLGQLLFVSWRGLAIVLEVFRGRRIGVVRQRLQSGMGPILLVHGLGMDHWCMEVLAWRLRRKGWGPIFLMNLGPWHWRIQEHAQLFNEEVKKLAALHGPVHVVAHSMGGLVARYALQDLNCRCVKSLVALATPHFGSPMARLAWTNSGRQLRLNDALLTRMNRFENPLPTEIRYLFIFSNLDVLVPGAWGGPKYPTPMTWFRMIPYCGHMSILLRKSIFTEIHKDLLQFEKASP